MEKILLPVDGSDSALRAVKHVIKHAENKGDLAVTLLYVHFTPVRFGSVGPELEPGEFAKIEKEYAAPALAEAEKLLREADISFKREVRASREPAVTIAKLADELGCDNIVMGKHGGGALSKVMVGSTAKKVAHLAETPVVLVK
jgi:nucleotide-binding universal stress UspA family protein